MKDKVMSRPGRLILLVLPLALAVALACSDDSPSLPNDGTEVPGSGSVQFGENFDLRIGETVIAANNAWSLTLAGVPSDSRCPVDVTCVRAGEVTVSVVADQQDGDDAGLKLTLGSTGSTSATFNNEFRVTLQAMSQAPKSEQTIPLGEYVVTLVVQRETDSASTSDIRGTVTLGPRVP